jgi:chromosome segregation ATPase
MYNHLAYETSSSLEYNLSRAVQHVKSAQQAHRQELEKKDEKILQLEKKLERLQSENRELTLEFTDYKRHNDKENNHYRDMLATNHFLEQELAMEKSRNEELRLELSRVRQELTCQEDKVAYLESEHDKANHIIKTLVKKVQNQQQMHHNHHTHTQRSPLSQTTAAGGGGATTSGAGSGAGGAGLLHHRIVT